MKFTDNEVLLFRRFCQEIINNPRPIDEQIHQRHGSKLWCEDWEIIEILKYLFLEKEVYYLDPPPNRLKNNPLWSKDEISRKAENYMEFYQGAEHIIKIMRELRTKNAAASRI